MRTDEREFIQLSASLRTAEEWSPLYAKTPEQHAKLLKLEAQLHLILARYYRDMAKSAKRFIRWDVYRDRLKLDYSVDVIFNDEEMDSWDSTFLKVTINTVAEIVATGAVAGEVLYKMPLNISSTDANIQKLSLDRVASLVGKRVLDDGTIIDNPNPKYNVNDTVRKDIAQAVKTSLGLGERTDDAIGRIQKTIANPARARRIAYTESVNAYQAGKREFGLQADAKGKEWLTAGAKDICLDYEARGPVPFNYEYAPGILQPGAHINCKCDARFIFAEEWDRLQAE